MATLIARRLLMLPLLLLGVSIVTFFLMQLVPGDPVAMLGGPESGGASEEAREALRAQWGLDKPIPIQYIFYLKNLFRGNLGKSIHTGNPVSVDLARRIPASVELGMVTFVFILVFGIPLGALSGAKKDTWVDHSSRVGALAFLSMPNFWVGLIIIYVFFYMLHVIPSPTGRIGIMDVAPKHITGLYILDSLLTGDFRTLGKVLWYIIPPAFTLSLTSIGLVVRMLRSSMVEIVDLDYIRTAKAKGLSYSRVFYVHALRNALIPTITVLALQAGSLIGGNVLVETVFNWPGVGLYFVESINWLDYAPVVGVATLAAAAFIGFNLLADVLYAVVDPRIRYD